MSVKKLLVSLLLVVSVLAAPVGAQYVILPPCKSLQSNAAIFTGDIVGLPTGPLYRRTYRVRVVDALWGVAKNEREVNVVIADGGAGKDSMISGRKYFDANRMADGSISCPVPRALKNAAADIRYIRHALATRRRASLTLRVYSITNAGLPVEISLVGARQSFHLKAHLDAHTPEEKLTVPKVSPGHYHVEAKLADHVLDTESREIDVAPGACLEADVRLVPDNSVTGVVVDADGNPVAGLPVQMLREPGPYDFERVMIGWQTKAKTREDGSFECWGIPPGIWTPAAGAGWQEKLVRYSPTAGNPVQIGITSRITGQKIVVGNPLKMRKLVLRVEDKREIELQIIGFIQALPKITIHTSVVGREPFLEIPIAQEMTYRLSGSAFEREITPGTQDVGITLSREQLRVPVIIVDGSLRDNRFPTDTVTCCPDLFLVRR